MKSRSKFLLFVLFILVSVAIAVASGYYGWDTTTVEKYVLAYPGYAAVLYTLIFSLLASFSFSISVMISLGAVLFSWQMLLIYAMAGIMTSATVHFMIARKLGRNYVKNYLEKHGGKLERFDNIVENDTFKTTLVFCVLFFVPPTFISLLGGVMKIKYKRFLIATFLGNLPNTFFTIFLIKGLVNSSSFEIYGSIIGIVLATLIALFFYKGELKDILRLSFPWAFGKNENAE